MGHHPLLPEPLMHSITLVVLSRKAVGFKNASIPTISSFLAVNYVRLWWKANLVRSATYLPHIPTDPSNTCLVASGTSKQQHGFKVSFSLLFPP